jgi:hypothetical protein
MQLAAGRRLIGRGLAMALMLVLGSAVTAPAAEPDPKTYWDIEDVRPGMKGTGQTVMVGTKLEEFGAEVLGVMRGVSPGRDMVLCRLTGCNLEHAGIIQGMSGSPIYIDGKLLGAVAFAWEFAKDPIAGVTPFQQMVQYVRANDKRIAAEAKDRDGKPAEPFRAAAHWDAREPVLIDGLACESAFSAAPSPAAGGTLAGMRAIATPLAAVGFSPRALAVLSERFGPLGLAPMAGGAAPERVIREEGNKPLEPGAPLSIALVTGDFDLSGIGTVTHVEGNRVYGFGHPMFGLGACEFPMMTGFIHTVNPRTSVSMKMGSPLKIVGVVDTDVSTGVAGRIGLTPDLIPVTVRVKTGPFSEPHTYRVQTIREPNLLSNLVMAVLTSAIDTEGNLPEELTARIHATVKLQGRDPIELVDTASGPRYTGPMGAAALFSPVASIINILVRNPMAPVRIESIACETEISAGRTVANIESVRLESDHLQPGGQLRAFATVKPFKGERETFEITVALPGDLEEGTYEANLCDLTSSLRRRFRNEPALLEPRDLNGVIETIRFQTALRRNGVFLHVPLPDRGLAVKGQALPNLPGSVRAVFASGRQSPEPPVRTDLIAVAQTPYVVEGAHTLKFTVVKDTGYSLR